MHQCIISYCNLCAKLDSPIYWHVFSKNRYPKWSSNYLCRFSLAEKYHALKLPVLRGQYFGNTRPIYVCWSRVAFHRHIFVMCAQGKCPSIFRFALSKYSQAIIKFNLRPIKHASQVDISLLSRLLILSYAFNFQCIVDILIKYTLP